ncbi:MAG: hypothetical protein ACI4O9_08105 [Akkermansia sp.]
MKRLAFNGGEISPAMALRTDMDVYPRSCTTVTNWNIHATGGISRRHGMTHLSETDANTSRLIPYIYSADQTYLIELSAQLLRVRRSSDALILATFEPTDDAPWRYDDLTRVTWLQINSLLLILSPSTPIMQLKCDSGDSWSYLPFEYATPPWQTEDYRDIELTLTPDGDIYRATYEAITDENGDPITDILPDDTDGATGDILRASYYTERREAYSKAAELADGLNICTALTTSTIISAGSKIARRDTAAIIDQYYICTKAWAPGNDYTKGYDSPANYPDNFDRADSSTGFTGDSAPTPITALPTTGSGYSKGDKIIYRQGYWHLYTCIRDFDGTQHLTTSTNPADYPKHFVRGICIGDTIPSGGKWQFYCSGTWYGTYEIRRNYESGALTEQWEPVGESISSIGSAANNIISGNEEEKECYLRLFLTQARFSTDSDPAAALPADYCHNRLIVQPYRHSMQLTVLADGTMEDSSPLIIPLSTPVTTTDWSWCAFNARYGYPQLATLHESRLVLAATATQPQTLWLSQSDDLNNFTTGDLDTSGMLLTMSTSTQAPICWILSRKDVIMIGTMDAEWILRPTTGGSGLTPSNAKILNQGGIGSAPQPAIAATDRVLYTERGGGRVYDYGYRYESDSYTSGDLTIFADHIADSSGGITGGDILKKPYVSIVFTTGSGQLLLMTYNTMHNVHAWHRYTTNGRIESVAVLPNGNSADRLYLITARPNTNGEQTRRIEVIDQDSEHYLDGQENYPYTSVIETTAFSAPDYNDRKTHTSALQAYLLPPLPPPSSIRCSTGGSYKPNDRLILAAGWNNFTAATNWHTLPHIGISVTGDTPCTILALQIGSPLTS